MERFGQVVQLILRQDSCKNWKLEQRRRGCFRVSSSPGRRIQERSVRFHRVRITPYVLVTAFTAVLTMLGCKDSRAPAASNCPADLDSVAVSISAGASPSFDWSPRCPM